MQPVPMPAYDKYIPPNLHIPWWMQYAFAWLADHGTVSILLSLIVIDIFLGIGISIVRGTLCSTICWRGMVRKVGTLLILSAVAIVGQVMPQIPSFELACIGFIVAELISILEAAAALGVPLPQVLVESLLKLKQQQSTRDLQKTIPPTNSSSTSQNVVIVNPASTPSVTTSGPNQATESVTHSHSHPHTETKAV